MADFFLNTTATKRLFLVLVESTSSLALPSWPGEMLAGEVEQQNCLLYGFPAITAAPDLKGPLVTRQSTTAGRFTPASQLQALYWGKQVPPPTLLNTLCSGAGWMTTRYLLDFGVTPHRVLLWTTGLGQEEPYSAFPKSSTLQCMIHVWQSWYMWVWMEAIAVASWLCVVLLLEVRRGKEGEGSSC